MVKKEEYEGFEAFLCEACGFHYKDRNEAEKCEKFCEEENMCNSEITSSSLERT